LQVGEFPVDNKFGAMHNGSATASSGRNRGKLCSERQLSRAKEKACRVASGKSAAVGTLFPIVKLGAG